MIAMISLTSVTFLRWCAGLRSFTATHDSKDTRTPRQLVNAESQVHMVHNATWPYIITFAVVAIALVQVAFHVWCVLPCKTGL